MTASGHPDLTAGSGGARPRTTPSQEDAQFRQKLRHMGKCMFSVFYFIYTGFSKNIFDMIILFSFLQTILCTFSKIHYATENIYCIFQ